MNFSVTARPQESLNKNTIRVYPNPCKQSPIITFDGLTRQATIRIFNIVGEEVIDKPLEKNDGDRKYVWEIPKRLASGVLYTNLN